MLTKQDISQIRKAVREEVESEVKDSTRTIYNQIRMSRIQIQHDVSELDDRMKNVEIRLDTAGKIIKDVKKKVNRIDKTVSIIAKNYDEGDVNLGSRVKKIEHHLGFAQV